MFNFDGGDFIKGLIVGVVMGFVMATCVFQLANVSSMLTGL